MLVRMLFSLLYFIPEAFYAFSYAAHQFRDLPSTEQKKYYKHNDQYFGQPETKNK